MTNLQTHKVAIPATNRTAQKPRHRTERACDSCRQRKAKCDGVKPTCSQCQSLRHFCCYSDVKRKRDRMEYESAVAKVEIYERSLRDISLCVDDKSLARRIEEVLGKSKSNSKSSKKPRAQKSNSPESSSSPPSSSPSSPSPASQSDESHETDIVKEDLNRSDESRATGFMGKNSEIAWLQQLEAQVSRLESDAAHGDPSLDLYASQQDPSSSDRPAGNNTLSSVSFYLDSIRLPGLGYDNPLELPPKPLADRLVAAFIESTDSSLPIIRESLFTGQYERLYSGAKPGNRWLAILNMVFAIGARHCELSHPNIHNDANHTTFFNRARYLMPGDAMLFENADLQEVQLELLMAFYFLATFQINRAWKMIGIAARSGIALGLNLRGNYTSIDSSSVEARNRAWWAIFLLEHTLSAMTSRSSCIANGSSSVYAPFPQEGGSVRVRFEKDFIRDSQLGWTLYQTPNQREVRRDYLLNLHPGTELCLFYLTDLAIITHAITNSVYPPDILWDRWARIEREIKLYDDQLHHWFNGLHHAFVFADKDGKLIREFKSKYQINLALNFYSVYIILTRPCLMRPKASQRDATGGVIPASQFSGDMARTCLHASMSLVGVFPNQPDISWIYNVLPWWTNLHYLMQAVTVLLIYLSVEPPRDATDQVVSDGDSGGGGGGGGNAAAIPAPVSSDAVLAAVKKAIRWLYYLGRTEGSFRRAFEICDNFIRRIASKRALDISDILPLASSLPPLASKPVSPFDAFDWATQM